MGMMRRKSKKRPTMEQFELTNIGYFERFLEALERNYLLILRDFMEGGCRAARPRKHVKQQKKLGTTTMNQIPIIPHRV